MTMRAVIYVSKKDEKICVHPEVRTDKGWLIAHEPFSVLPYSDMDGFHAQLTTALEASRESIPHPKGFDFLAPLIKKAGYKNSGAFVKKMTCIQVLSDGQDVELIPQVSDGRGYSPDEDSRVIVNGMNKAEIREAVNRFAEK